MRTENHVRLRGYVGKYSRIPTNREDPARFDIMTIERFKTEDGGLVSKKTWHAVFSWDTDLVEKFVHQGAWVEVLGRLDIRMVEERRLVSVEAKVIRVLMTQRDRDILRSGRQHAYEYEGEEIEWGDEGRKAVGT